MKTLLAAALAVMVMVMAATSARAADAKTFALGGIKLIALADTDSSISRPDNLGLLVGLTEADRAKYLSAPGSMKNSINCFIVDNGKETILFDTGLGNGGLLQASLARAGISPDAIDAVVITHFHGDHIGGLMRDGAAAFRNARLLVPRVEMEAMAQAAASFQTAYAGRLQTFEWNSPVVEGIVAIDASGHTPGHTVFEVTSGSDKLMILGDLIHFGAIQLPVPNVAVTYDSDTTKAIAARKRLFDKAAAEGCAVVAMHLPFPSFGTLSKAGAGYAFTEKR